MFYALNVHLKHIFVVFVLRISEQINSETDFGVKVKCKSLVLDKTGKDCMDTMYN